MSMAKTISVPRATGGRMIQLDVLRGIAILLVLCRHTVLPWSYAGRPCPSCITCIAWAGLAWTCFLSSADSSSAAFCSTRSSTPGARRVDQLLDNVSALDLVLPDEQRAVLDQISAPELAFPASANRAAPSIQFAGAMVDGRQTQTFPVLGTSPARY